MKDESYLDRRSHFDATAVQTDDEVFQMGFVSLMYTLVH